MRLGINRYVVVAGRARTLLRGQLSVGELLGRARGDTGQLTEARAYAGILATIKGDREGGDRRTWSG